ncbi:MAG TPA: hypothetical protein VKD25_09305, partial [Burkholderiales bacterium]|nr:hypothetical protein [Burkholderiales bacterium]
MAAISPNAAQPEAGIRTRLFPGLAERWRRWRGDRSASGLSVPVGIGLLCIFWGSAVAVGGLNA